MTETKTELLPVMLINHDGIGVYIHGVMADGSENMVMDCNVELRIRGWGGLTGGRGLDDVTAMKIQKMWADEICKRYNEYSAKPVEALPVDKEAPLEDVLISKDGFYETEIEQIAFELAAELEDAQMDPNDFVTVNREKLKGIAQRILKRAALTTPSIPLSVAEELANHLRDILTIARKYRTSMQHGVVESDFARIEMEAVEYLSNFNKIREGL